MCPNRRLVLYICSVVKVCLSTVVLEFAAYGGFIRSYWRVRFVRLCKTVSVRLQESKDTCVGFIGAFVFPSAWTVIKSRACSQWRLCEFRKSHTAAISHPRTSSNLIALLAPSASSVHVGVCVCVESMLILCFSFSLFVSFFPFLLRPRTICIWEGSRVMSRGRPNVKHGANLVLCILSGASADVETSSKCVLKERVYLSPLCRLFPQHVVFGSEGNLNPDSLWGETPPFRGQQP